MNTVYIILFIITLCLISSMAYGQTFAEWFQQKKTRIKYLEAQDAALAALKLTTEDGYQIEGTGLDSISTIKDEEYQLHQQHFNGLRIVNPQLKNSPELMASMVMEGAVVDMVTTNLQNYNQTPWLSSDERTMLKNLLPGVINDIHESVESLRDLVTDNYLQLSDGERTQAIDTTAKEIITLYDYTIGTIVSINQFIETRQETEKEIENLKNLFP